MPLQQDAGNPEQPVSDAPQGTAVGVTARPQRVRHLGSVSTATRAQWNTALRNRTWAA